MHGFNTFLHRLERFVNFLQGLSRGLRLQVDLLHLEVQMFHFLMNGLKLLQEGLHLEVHPSPRGHLLFDLLVDLAFDVLDRSVLDVQPH